MKNNFIIPGICKQFAVATLIVMFVLSGSSSSVFAQNNSEQNLKFVPAQQAEVVPEQKALEYQVTESVTATQTPSELTPEEKYKNDPVALEEIKFMHKTHDKRKSNQIQVQLEDIGAKLAQIENTINGINQEKGVSEDVKNGKRATLLVKQNELVKEQQKLKNEYKTIQSRK